MTTTIRQQDLIDSIAGALQYISYYHPADYIAHLARAYEREQSPAAKDAMAQILTNSKMSATGHRPICQDTGIVNVFLKVGMDVRWEDRKSTRLNSSHLVISYAVFCLKKKKNTEPQETGFTDFCAIILPPTQAAALLQSDPFLLLRIAPRTGCMTFHVA